MRIIGILPTCASTHLCFKVLLEATLWLTWNEKRFLRVLVFEIASLNDIHL
ncbi:2343_t:CDS:2 [Entrophospora sp. SA101]|nr:2343_t:CDS:2 [Entrophospora sp. SA101]CAJ0851982.1 17079_t:CDS:2 [Entrophospora sp. SA101]CAJ0882037.1 2218_t:CDS:2 [Entrophospora sp. SA101]